MATPEPTPQAEPLELTPTGKVILGMLAFGKNTGYEIKQFVDKSTRFFWAASYGQIYPELKRLEDQGLVRGRSEPSGGRARTVFELTDAGSAALNRWLSADEEQLYELRDEGMLKLFFSDCAPERRIENIRAMRERQERKLAQLREIEPIAQRGPEGPRLTLELGIGFTQWMVDWCRATERRLAGEHE
ncbi:MAG TPA: PadR family transcriptional regulator [Solirubrobacteraceae bacterium]|nr:PadR family transcriptional regulator [Solirubrobacteraceae bacterium]